VIVEIVTHFAGGEILAGSHDMPLRLVLVDVDGTLIDGQSYTSLLKELWQRGWRRWRLVGLLCSRLPYQLLRRLHLTNRMENQVRWARGMAWLLAGAAVPEVQALMSAACRRLAPRIRTALVTELDEHRRAGREICLASTAIEPLLAELAPLVHAERWVGTRVAVADGRYTGGLSGDVCHGAGKLERVEAAAGRGIDWAGSYAYSDGLPDLPMLERVGQPVVVDPDRELAAIARSRSWRVV